jgi:hypothetical protein
MPLHSFSNRFNRSDIVKEEVGVYTLIAVAVLSFKTPLLFSLSLFFAEHWR